MNGPYDRPQGDRQQADPFPDEEVSAPEAVPFDGTVLQYAAALGSVGAGSLGPLLGRAQAHLDAHLDAYRREFECVEEDEARSVFFVPRDHWEAVGDDLGFEERETKAVQRTHEQQLLRIGSETDRRAEFDTALEIRSAVVVGHD